MLHVLKMRFPNIFHAKQIANVSKMLESPIDKSEQKGRDCRRRSRVTSVSFQQKTRASLIDPATRSCRRTSPSIPSTIRFKSAPNTPTTNALRWPSICCASISLTFSPTTATRCPSSIFKSPGSCPAPKADSFSRNSPANTRANGGDGGTAIHIFRFDVLWFTVA